MQSGKAKRKAELVRCLVVPTFEFETQKAVDVATREITGVFSEEDVGYIIPIPETEIGKGRLVVAAPTSTLCKLKIEMDAGTLSHEATDINALKSKSLSGFLTAHDAVEFSGEHTDNLIQFIDTNALKFFTVALVTLRPTMPDSGGIPSAATEIKKRVLGKSGKIIEVNNGGITVELQRRSASKLKRYGTVSRLTI